MKTQWDIFIAFFRVGMLGYGGGPGSIPLIHKEVEKYQWMTGEEFGDILALSNTLPGPVATKLAGYIGYRVAGIIGMLNALIASVLPTVVLMILFLKTLTSFKDLDWIKGMTAAVVPVVGVMLAVLTWQFFEKAGKGMGWIKTSLMTVVALFLLSFLEIHPGIIIALVIAIALIQKASSPSKGKAGDGS